MNKASDLRETKLGQIARLIYGRTGQFFSLPRLYSKIRAFNDCPRSRARLTADLLALFFSYKTFPDHYGPCRLWEVDRPEWGYYYGSNYHPHQRLRLARSVQRSEYRVLFDDKFLCAMYCKGLDIRIPRTFGAIDPGEDYRGRIISWFETLQVPKMIIKPLCGRAGLGIVLAERTGGGYVVRSQASSLPLDRYILDQKAVVQEYIDQDTPMAAFSPSSLNTIRVVTMLSRDDRVLLVNASMRTGAGGSFIDNFSSGGISAGVDRGTGRLNKYAYDNKWNRYERHPDSGILFEGYAIPHWDRVIGLAAAVQKHFAYYRLIGSDIAIGTDGEPILVEVNGAPDLVGLEQKAGPILKDPEVLEAFGDHGLLVNSHQKARYSALKARVRGKITVGGRL